jgi:hypothetical protein
MIEPRTPRVKGHNEEVSAIKIKLNKYTLIKHKKKTK